MRWWASELTASRDICALRAFLTVVVATVLVLKLWVATPTNVVTKIARHNPTTLGLLRKFSAAW